MVMANEPEVVPYCGLLVRIKLGGMLFDGKVIELIDRGVLIDLDVPETSEAQRLTDAVKALPEEQVPCEGTCVCVPVWAIVDLG